MTSSSVPAASSRYLLDLLAQVQDPRKKRGRRHPLAGLLAVGIAAVIAGSKSFAAIGQWAAEVGPEALAGLGAVRGAADESTFRRAFALVSPDVLDRVLGAWLWTRAVRAGGRLVIAIDGKTVRGARNKAEQVPGLAKLAVGGRFSAVETMSCPSPGNCGAGGSYITSAGQKGGARQEAFVVSEKNGTWGSAEEAPGTAKLNVGGAAEFNQVTCTSAGNCLGVGFYQGKVSSGPFAVTEKRGIWGTARTFPRIMALTAVKARDFVGFAEITGISCQSTGNCTGVGFYCTDENQDSVFAFSQKNGIWGAITPIPFTGDLPGGVGQVN